MIAPDAITCRSHSFCAEKLCDLSCLRGRRGMMPRRVELRGASSTSHRRIWLDTTRWTARPGRILLYVESIKDARKFMSAARAAARIKPVVVVKSAAWRKARRAAAPNTGALAGSDAVYDAAFRRAGILRVSDLRELFDCAETLGACPNRLRENGWRSSPMAAHRCSRGDRLVELEESRWQSRRLRERSSDASCRNVVGIHPVDIVGDADPARYAGA